MTRHLRTVLLSVVACGLVLFVTSLANPGVAQPPKGNPLLPPGVSSSYQMLTWGRIENPYLILLDTRTGRAWGMLLSRGVWEDMQTPLTDPGGLAKEKARP